MLEPRAPGKETTPPTHEFLGKIFALPIEPIHTTRDTDCNFPAPASHFVRADGQEVIQVQNFCPTIEEMKDDYCGEGLSVQDFNIIYFRTAAIHAGVRSYLQDFSLEKINDIYKILNSPDELMRKIYGSSEAGLISEAQSGFLLAAFKENWITVDPAHLNATRYSLGLLREALPNGAELLDKFEAASLRILQETLSSGRTKYETVFKAFGEESVEAQAQRFANAIPAVQLAGSFPMDPAEVRLISDSLANN